MGAMGKGFRKRSEAIGKIMKKNQIVFWASTLILAVLILGLPNQYFFSKPSTFDMWGFTGPSWLWELPCLPGSAWISFVALTPLVLTVERVSVLAKSTMLSLVLSPGPAILLYVFNISFRDALLTTIFNTVFQYLFVLVMSSMSIPLLIALRLLTYTQSRVSNWIASKKLPN